MSLDVTDTISSSFSRLSSKSSLGLIGFILGLMLVVGGGTLAATAATTVSTALAVVIGAAVAVAYLAGVASFTVGSLRVLDEQTVEKESFTENIVWPFLRMTGSNIIVQSFMLMAAYLVLYPALLLGLGTSGLMTMGSETVPELGTAAYATLGVGGLITAFAALYVLSALSLSLPRIAISDKRMFQSLDESVQATSGLRLKVIATMIPFAALIAIALASIVLVGGIAGTAVYGLTAVIGGLYWLALLAELNERL